MDNPIAAIEQAIVNRLTLLHSQGAWNFRCQYIDSYGGQFDSAEELAQAAAKAPGLWVTFDGESGVLENGIHQATLTYAVFALAKSFSPEQLRRGGPNVTGLYQLIEAVRLALVNQTLGEDMTPMSLIGVTPLWRGGPQGGGISLSVMRFVTEVSVGVPPAIELDEKICPRPLFVSAWEVMGGPIITDKWRRNENDDLETEAGQASIGSEPNSAPASAGSWLPRG